MNDRFRRAFEGAVRRHEERQWVYGLLGRKNSDGSYTFDVPGRRGFVYVTLRNASGAQTVVPARNDFGVEKRPNLGVRMKLENSVYVVLGRANRSDLVQTPDTTDYGLPSHPLDIHSDTNFGTVGTRTDGHVVTWDSTATEFVLAEGGSTTDVAAEIDAATELDPPSDTMRFAGTLSGALRWVTWANIKTALNALYVGLTGNQTIAGIKTFTSSPVFGDGSGAISATLNGAVGTLRSLLFQSNGSNRWLLTTNSDAETGSDAGSNLEIRSRTDAGADKSTVMHLNRATGYVGIGTNAPDQLLTVNGLAHIKSLRTGSISVATNTATLLDVTDVLPARGVMVLSAAAGNEWALIHYRVDGVAQSGLMISGGVFETTTGVLTGTTGLANRITVSPDVDNGVYFENRMSSTRGIRYTILSGL